MSGGRDTQGSAGTRLLRWAEKYCPRDVVEGIVRPIIADLQFEDATGSRSRLAKHFIRLRANLALVRALALHAVTRETARKPSRVDRRMRWMNSILGLIIMAAGFSLAGWAPLAFEVFSGRTLPVPVPTDATAMTIWSGVAFVRVFGAVFFGLGAVLWGSHTRTLGPRATQKALFVSSAFATLVVLAQQVAIWSNAVGVALVGLLCALMIVSGINLLRSGELITSGPPA
jgi:hypothetical protein